MEALVKDYWKAFQIQDYDLLYSLFQEDARITWPNTKEQFDRETFCAINRQYPGNWKETIQHITMLDTQEWLSEVLVEGENISFYAISIFTIQNDKIQHIREYWSANEEPPAWRKAYLNARKSQ